MRQADKMFQVIVAGGIALATPAVAAATVGGCGGSTTTASDAGFPQETAQPDAFPQETGAQPDAFPQEGPPPPPDASSEVDAADGAVPLDAGDDAPCFPQETALPLDSGCR
jgi:hypothetical protein